MSPKKKPVWCDFVRTKPFGSVWFAVSERGLWRLDFPRTERQFRDSLLADNVEPCRDRRRTDPVKRALKGYFSGKPMTFDVPIDWSRVGGFTRRALQVCARIPYGRTLSYGEVAHRAGSPGGARAAGQAMSKNPFPVIVPCHRVIASGGRIGGFSGGLGYKRALLDLEKCPHG